MTSNEEKYYEPIRKWLENNGYYTGGGIEHIDGKKKGEERFYTKTGTKNLKGDVVGLRFSGNELFDDVEICVIEVKDKSSINRGDLHQAYGYTTYSHIVYLATPCDLKVEMKSKLIHFGIGYIQIKKRSKNYIFNVILTPSRNIPIEKDKLKLLSNLWIGRCTLCKCYFPKLRFSNAPRIFEYLTIERPKIFSEDGMNDYPDIDKDNTERFLCYHCAVDLFGPDEGNRKNYKKKVKKMIEAYETIE